jgi:hypothetical protein
VRILIDECVHAGVRAAFPGHAVSFSNRKLANTANPGYLKRMVDLKLQVPVTDEVEVSPETLAAIDRGIADADGSRTVRIEEVRKLIPQWISKFESQKPR